MKIDNNHKEEEFLIMLKGCDEKAPLFFVMAVRNQDILGQPFNWEATWSFFMKK